MFESQFFRARTIAERNFEVDLLMMLKKLGKLKVTIDLNMEIVVLKQHCEAFLCAGSGNTEELCMLVKKDIGVNVQDEKGKSLIYVASKHGQTDTVSTNICIL